jgi:aminoglycoside phosphotransferase (APT) family kinase protein
MRLPDEDDARERLGGAVGSRFELTRRDTRWLAIGDELVAFLADDDAGWRRLTKEAWLIDRWRAAGVPVPRVVHMDPARRLQLLERIRGRTGDDIHRETGTSPLYTGAVPDAAGRLGDAPLSAFGERLAASYGELAARIRSAVRVDDAIAAGLAPTSRRVLDLDDAIARLHASTASPAAKTAATRARSWLAAIPPVDAVIHGDLHFFNMCVDDAGSIIGVFDLGDAGLDAAATELMYVHSLGSRFAAIVLDANRDIALEDVRRAHLRTALDHLIWHGPGTLRHPSIVGWVTAVFERLV